MVDAWFYSPDGNMGGSQQVGPMPLAELKRLLRQGTIAPMTPVWMQGAVAPITAAQAAGDAPVGHGDERGLQYVVPTSNTSGMALASGYLGIFGIFICPLGIAALITGILGLRDLKAHPQKNGTGRAWTGIVLGSLQILGSLIWLVLWLLRPSH